MYNWTKAAALCAIILVTMPAPGSAQDNPYAGRDSELGRDATAAEIGSWDIDVRPDLTGLPDGAGTALQGEDIWLQKCASCHGDFGDANNFFSPLVLGNVTDDDIAVGHVAALTDPTRVRTTLMKVPTISTLWDYINRAMPWNNPKSLSSDEVYALLAYLLNLAYIIEEDFVLDRASMAEVQDLMPNRNGMTREHGLWKVDGKPDVSNERCMNKCREAPAVVSFIPQFAMDAHGDLALQNRQFGPFRGLDTPGKTGAVDVPKETVPEGEKLATDRGCTICHQLDQQLVGPAFIAVSRKYAGDDGARDYLSEKIRAGSSGVWGGMMPPQAGVNAKEADDIAGWLMSLTSDEK